MLENQFGPGKSWKLKVKVSQSPAIYLWFKLYNKHSAEFERLLAETVAVNIEMYKVFLLSGKPHTFFSTCDEYSAIHPWIICHIVYFEQVTVVCLYI